MQEDYLSTLRPFRTPQKEHERSDLLLTFSEPLLRATHHEFRAFKEWILTVQDEYDSSPLKHPLVVTLFQTYAHVFPKEIPTGLSPKHDIQHHIDLIREAIFPNKSAYRMNPKDTMRIQRQVEELVSKGLV